MKKTIKKKVTINAVSLSDEVQLWLGTTVIVFRRTDRRPTRDAIRQALLDKRPELSEDQITEATRQIYREL